LEEAEAVLATQMAKLHQKQAELQAITDKLNGLKDQLKTKEEEKVVRCSVKFNFSSVPMLLSNLFVSEIRVCVLF
jgi:hypothetical protein